VERGFHPPDFILPDFRKLLHLERFAFNGIRLADNSHRQTPSFASSRQAGRIFDPLRGRAEGGDGKGGSDHAT
jgi:hypothetical protein